MRYKLVQGLAVEKTTKPLMVKPTDTYPKQHFLQG